jgi:hypothetical protein
MVTKILGPPQHMAKRLHGSKAANRFVSKIEVERKFEPTALLKSFLGKSTPNQHLKIPRTNTLLQSGCAPGLTLIRLPSRIIRDRYLDDGDILSNKGVWIRYRESRTSLEHESTKGTGNQDEGEWEAKLRLAGDYVDSQFCEVYGLANVERILRKHMPGACVNDLPAKIDIHTARQTWKVALDDAGRSNVQSTELRIDLDVATVPDHPVGKSGPFRHEVGEVEATTEVVGGSSKDEHDMLRRRKAEEIHRMLQDFMKQHANLFGPPTLGKLSAFFGWKNEQRK